MTVEEISQRLFARAISRDLRLLEQQRARASQVASRFELGNRISRDFLVPRTE